MKKLSLRIIGPLLLAGLFTSANPATAQPYWDGNGTDASAGNNTAGGGANFWNTSASDWWNNSGFSDVVWPSGDIANFAGTAATVTVNGPVTANGLAFTSASYSIAGSSTLTLGGAPSTISLPPTSLGATTTTTISCPLAVLAGLTLNGSAGAVLNLTGADAITGNMTINGGTIQVGSGGELNSGNYAGNIATTVNALEVTSLVPPASFNYDSTAAQILPGIISGSGVIAQNGAGTLTLAGANTYTGYTTIDHGSLALTGSGSINNSPFIVIFNSGTFDVSALPSPYNLSTSTTLFGTGAGTASPATLKGAASGIVNLGPQPIQFYYTHTGNSGDTTHPAITVSQGSLELSGNQIGVSNNDLAMGAGTYVLMYVPHGIAGLPNAPVVVIGAGWANGLVSGDVASASVNGTGNTNVILTVTAAANKTTLTTIASPITYGQSVTATVTPSSGSLPLSGGVVQFLGNDGSPLGGPVAVNTATGVATLSSPLLAVGTYTNFTAIYSGSGAFGASAATPENLVVQNSFPQVSFTSEKIVGSGLQVCWPTVPGVVYNVLTNGNLLNGGAASWVQDTSVGNAGAVTGDGNTDCVIIPSATLPSTNLFVLIQQNSN